MPKALCIISLCLSVFLFVVFVLDLVAGFPFGKASFLMDLAFIVCSGGLAALSFFCLREQR